MVLSRGRMNNLPVVLKERQTPARCTYDDKGLGIATKRSDLTRSLHRWCRNLQAEGFRNPGILQCLQQFDSCYLNGRHKRMQPALGPPLSTKQVRLQRLLHPQELDSRRRHEVRRSDQAPCHFSEVQARILILAAYWTLNGPLGL